MTIFAPGIEAMAGIVERVEAMDCDDTRWQSLAGYHYYYRARV